MSLRKFIIYEHGSFEGLEKKFKGVFKFSGNILFDTTDSLQLDEKKFVAGNGIIDIIEEGDGLKIKEKKSKEESKDYDFGKKQMNFNYLNLPILVKHLFLQRLLQMSTKTEILIVIYVVEKVLFQIFIMLKIKMFTLNVHSIRTE